MHHDEHLAVSPAQLQRLEQPRVSTDVAVRRWTQEIS